MTDADHYDYELPKELIAQHPTPSRVDARLLLVDRARNELHHYHVRDLPELLNAGDCLVLNDTRVVPARLMGRRDLTGGNWEGLFLEMAPGGLWRILSKTRGKLEAEESVTLVNAAGQDDVRLRMGMKQDDGSWIVRPESKEETFALLERVGRVPLPPYIRKGEMEPADRTQYQTVYARCPGAVAAPTAGLHFSEGLRKRLREQGVEICHLTLHTGAGTFRPIATENVAEHKLDAEWATVGAETVEKINRCRQAGRTHRRRGNDLGPNLGNGRPRRHAQAIHWPHRSFRPPTVYIPCRDRLDDEFSFAAYNVTRVGAYFRRR